MNLLYLLPKNLASHWVGWFVHLNWPKPIAKIMIRNFAKAYQINVSEAELELEQYSSIGEFFTRRLKTGLRPIANQAIVHPADSVITQIEPIKNGQMIQAKGKTYTVGELTQNPLLLSQLEDGFFITYYLCPTDYHRVHSPVSGEIKSVSHIPGSLWPVNSWSTEHIDKLFCKNERVVVEIQTSFGDMFVVFVGATNVGKISMSFDSEIITNQNLKRKYLKKQYSQVQIKKGDELGVFHMGSTVVLLYPRSAKASAPANLETLKNKAVKYGEGLI
jgi:phosphatidylserine decarboxylase